MTYSGEYISSPLLHAPKLAKRYFQWEVLYKCWNVATGSISYFHLNTSERAIVCMLNTLDRSTNVISLAIWFFQSAYSSTLFFASHTSDKFFSNLAIEQSIVIWIYRRSSVLTWSNSFGIQSFWEAHRFESIFYKNTDFKSS